MELRLLEITVLSAKDLNNVNFIDIMDVYVIISIDQDKLQQQVVTPVNKYIAEDPYWDFYTKFIIDEAAHQNIVFKLRCQRFLGDKTIGEVRLPINELLQSPEAIDGKKQIVSHKVRKPDGRFRGFIKFAYQFEKKVKKAEEQPNIVYPTPHGTGSSSANPPSAPMYQPLEGGYPLRLHLEEGYPPPSEHSEVGYYLPTPPHLEEGYPPPPQKLSEGAYAPPQIYPEGLYNPLPPPPKYPEGGDPKPPTYHEGAYIPPPPPSEGEFPPPPKYSQGGYYVYYVTPPDSERGYHLPPPPPPHYHGALPPPSHYHGASPPPSNYHGVEYYPHPPPHGGYHPPPAPGHVIPPPQPGYGHAPAMQKQPEKKSKDEEGSSGVGLIGGAVGRMLIGGLISGGGAGDVGFDF